MSLVDALIQGLTAPVSEAQRAAYASPPYPTPPTLVAPRASVLGELEARLPADGDGPMTVTRVLGPVQPYRLQVRSLRRPGPFRFADAACALLAVGAVTDDGAETLRPHLPPSCGIGRQQVLNRLAADDITGASAAADRIEGGTGWKGHRDIAAALADRGDAAGFFAGWKRCAPAKDRHGLADLKRRLVEGVARASGWEAALALTADKRLGPAFAMHAFTAFGADVDGLRRVLAGVGALPELDQLTLLAEAVRQAAGKDPASDHPYLPELVDRIIAVDPATDRAIVRTRDWLLFSLWPAMGEQATLERARKAIRTPQYKRELHRLPRDVTASLRHRPAS
ncbi:hypothetical protein [Dactylosporangium matsuzakiense]|nr:hypothetical protein [Dactylosporangium matsuzakiense]UWZ41253.1 hypothetical protein Dmats_26630 [Dactylosporangium matsuzakiense]